jgi:hypothetical protein
MLSTLCNSFDYSPVLPRSDYVLIFSQCTNIYFTTFSHCAPTKILQHFLTVHQQRFCNILSRCTYIDFATFSHCAPTVQRFCNNFSLCTYIYFGTSSHCVIQHICILHYFLNVYLHILYNTFSLCTVHLHIFCNIFH